MNIILPDEGYEIFLFEGAVLVTELLFVLFSKGLASRSKIAEAPEHEEQSRKAPRKYSITEPFCNLAEIVGGSHILI